MNMLSFPTVFQRTTLAAVLLLVTCLVACGQAYHNPGTTGGWAGIFFTKKHLKGQASFQLGIQQSANSIKIVFNAAYNDGHGAAPEGHGSARIAGKDMLEFQFVDSARNSGSGTIKRAGNDIIVDFIFANAVDKNCLDFYGRNMHLSRAGKK